jgi:hypothetical protein
MLDLVRGTSQSGLQMQQDGLSEGDFIEFFALTAGRQSCSGPNLSVIKKLK